MFLSLLLLFLFCVFIQVRKKIKTLYYLFSSFPFISLHSQFCYCHILFWFIYIGNFELSRNQEIDSFVNLKGKLSRYSASRQLSRYILAQCAADNAIKSMTQKEQARTAGRKSINLPHQYRWHIFVDSLIAQMREKNTRLCCNTGNIFGELIAHFIVGLDEMCLMPDAFGYFYFIGTANIKNIKPL